MLDNSITGNASSSKDTRCTPKENTQGGQSQRVKAAASCTKLLNEIEPCLNFAPLTVIRYPELKHVCLFLKIDFAAKAYFRNLYSARPFLLAEF